MNRAIIVTGASSGIGKATACLLAQQGFRVFATVRKEEDAARLRAESGAITPIIMDVTDPDSIRDAQAFVRTQLHGGGLYGLVNNAGIGVAGPLEYIHVETMRNMFEVDVFGQMAVTQAFMPLLRAGKGRIINIGSVGAHISMPFAGPWAAN